jgi:hypothetical protein
MTTPPRRAGTRYEGQQKDWWNGQGPPFDEVDRQPLRGTRDTGDLDGFPEVSIPGTGRFVWVAGCKAETTIRLGDYMDEMREQGANLLRRRKLAGVLPVELVKRRNCHDGTGSRSYAVMEAGTLAAAMRLMHWLANPETRQP